MIETSPIRLLQRDVKIWLINAGKDRKFLEEFIRSRRVFLEIPGFVGAAGLFGDDELVRRHLARSWAINEYVRGATGSPPSRNLANYSAYPFASGTADSRAFGELVGNAIRLFDGAKAGDVVLVPRYGTFAPFLVGEITRDWDPLDSREIPQMRGEATATRRVRWLETAVARSDFIPKIGKRLVNRHAVTEVPSDFYQDIFNKIYPNYAWGGISKLDIFGNGYSGKDPTQPFIAAQLIKYVLSSVFAFEKGEIDRFNALSIVSIQSAIDAYYDEALVDDLAQNFNSPGRFTVVGRLGLLSLLTSAALLLATSKADGGFVAQKAAVSQQISSDIVGSPQLKDQATVEIDNFLSSAEGSVWEPVQSQLGQPAAANMGLSLNNRVELERKRAEFDQ